MTGKTHAVFGVNMLWFLLVFYSPELSPVLIPLAAFGSLLPDLDASESTVKHLRARFGHGRRAISVKPLFLPAMIIGAFSRHRGFFHSLLATLGFAILSFFIVQWVHLNYVALDDTYWLAPTLGYLSHLLTDAMTKSGVPLFWPWRRNIHVLPAFLRIKTGGLIEQIILVLASGLLFFLLWKFYAYFPLPALA